MNVSSDSNRPLVFQRCFLGFFGFWLFCGLSLVILFLFIVFIMSKKGEVEASMKSLFEESKDLEFPEIVNKVHAYLYEMFEGQRNKGAKFTADVMSTTRKCFDFIGLSLVRAHRDYVASEAKLKTLVTNSKAYEALAEKFSRSSSHSAFPKRPIEKTVVPVAEPSFSVIVSSSGDRQIDDIKKEIKTVCRSGGDMPIPEDVVVTKAGQLIIRVKSRADTVKVRDTLSGMENLKENIKITVPRRRLDRVLILSVEPDVEEASLRSSLDNIFRGDCSVEEEGDEGVFEIIKKIPTKSGKVNWLVGVRGGLSRILISRRRICIDMERYRVVDFIPVVRCFNCQEFGHTAVKCEKDSKCVKCAGQHNLKDCNVDDVTCSNCLHSSNTDIDVFHRADSSECPYFKSYRADLLSKRL